MRKEHPEHMKDSTSGASTDQDPVVEALLAQLDALSSNESVEGLQAATEALAKLESLVTPPAPVLKQAETMSDVREFALHNLADHPELVRALHSSPDRNVQEKLLEIIDGELSGPTGDGSLLRACCRALSSDADRPRRDNVAARLCLLNRPGIGVAEFFGGPWKTEGMGKLIEIYKAGNIELKKECLEAFKGSDDPRVHELLVQEFRERLPRDPLIRSICAAMQGTRSVEVVKSLLGEVRKLGDEFYGSENWWNPLPGAVHALKSRIYGVSSYRSEAALALSCNEDPKVVMALTAGLRDDDSEFATMCARALKGTRNPESFVTLYEILTDPRKIPALQDACAEALQGCMQQQIVASLRSHLNSPQSQIAVRAATALKGAADHGTQGLLSEGLMDQNNPQAFRAACASALSAASCHEALKALETCLADSDDDIVRGCLNSLADRGKWFPMAPLSHPNPDIQELASRVLQGRLGIGAVWTLIEETEVEAPGSLFKLLALKGSPQAAAHLAKLLDANDARRECAALALGLEHDRARPIILAALSSGDSQIAREAARQIGAFLGGRPLEPLQPGSK